MAKIVPSERLRRELDEVLAGVGEQEDPVEAIARLGRAADHAAGAGGRGDRVPRPRALRARRRRRRRSTATATSPGRSRRRAARWSSSARGSATRRELGFESQVLGKGVARTHALEALVIRGFLRGLSVRDVEAPLEECFGEQVISKSTVARVCQDTRERYAAWCERDLSEHDLVYCYLDAIYLKLRPTTSPPRACWSPGGSRWRARRCCSGCSSAAARATSRWLDFGRDLRRAGCARRR